MSHEAGFIEEPLYTTIRNKIPICTSTGILSDGNKILLLKRKGKIGDGLWWLPGGRIYKYETPEITMIREMLEETNIVCDIVKQIKTNSIFLGIGHAVDTLFLLDSPNKKVVLNEEHIDYGWFTVDEIRNLEPIHPFLLYYLELAGFIKKTVVTSGIFDLLHYGHITLLHNAKNLYNGNTNLIVLLGSDAHSIRVKNKTPMIKEDERKKSIISLGFVDEVIIIRKDEEYDHEGLLIKINPDIYVIGFDQTELYATLMELKIKHNLKYEIKQISHEYNSVVSSSQLLKKGELL